MIDWKRKLTSRKFWGAICAFVTNLVLAFGVAQETAVQITAIIMAGAAVVAYIIGEGLTDMAGVANTVVVQGYDDNEEDEDFPDDEEDGE